MSESKRILVMGGSAAGPKAAARAKRLDPDARITIIQKAPELSMASCGYPYFISGVFDNRNALLSTPYGEVRDPNFFENTKGIEARTETEVMAVDRQHKTVQCRDLKSDAAEGVGPAQFKKELDQGKTPYILDVRTPGEFDTMRLGIGETLIPIGELRRRLDDLPVDREREIICYCKISLRGYEAAILLEAAGWKNVKVLEGGVMAWPFPREK